MKYNWHGLSETTTGTILLEGYVDAEFEYITSQGKRIKVQSKNEPIPIAIKAMETLEWMDQWEDC